MASTANHCTKHGKDVEFHCITHNASICSKCAIFGHKSCSIADLADVAEYQTAKESAANLKILLELSIVAYEAEGMQIENRVKGTLEIMRRNMQNIEENLVSTIHHERQEKLSTLTEKKMRCESIIEAVDKKMQEVIQAQSQGDNKATESLFGELKNIAETNQDFLQTEADSIITNCDSDKYVVNFDGILIESDLNGSITIKAHCESDGSITGHNVAQVPVGNIAVNAESSSGPSAPPMPSASSMSYQEPAIQQREKHDDAELPSYDQVVSSFKNFGINNANYPPGPRMNLPPGSTANMQPAFGSNPGMQTAHFGFPDSQYPYQNPSAAPPHVTFTPDGNPKPLEADGEILLNVKSTSDKENCSITGVTFLTDGRLVVVDKHNRKLKLFHLSNTQLPQSEVLLPHAPYDVVQAPSGKIAVTIPKLGALQMYIVGTHLALDHGSTIRIGKCQGVAANSSYLFVASHDDQDEQQCIYVYDAQNAFVRSIPLKVSQYGQLEVCPKHGNLYFKSLSMGKEKIYCMRTDGQILWKSKVKSWIDQPYGFAALNSGLMVSIDGIYFLSGGGVHWNKLCSMDFTGPLAVSMDLGKVAVAYRSGPGNRENMVSIFKIDYWECA